MDNCLRYKKACCGCSACANICPQNCIKLLSDKEGFLYPKIDASRCINCGQCIKVCPYDGGEEERPPLYTLAAINNDDKIRLLSSSGGIFSVLANYIVQNNGIVFGATFDKSFNVIHDCSTSYEGISKFRGSKYVQSDLTDTFKRIRDYLICNRLVLFSGTPCQVLGLKRFLGREYPNLYTVDLMCHGVSSPKVWEWYLKIQNQKITKVNFRDKVNGWRNPHFSIMNEDKNGVVSLYILEKFSENPFTKAYLNNLSLRPSCYNCIAKKGCSGSDITLGDFWGIENVGLDDDKGTSIVLINTIKGKELFSNQDITASEVDFSTAIRYNPVWSQSVPAHHNRTLFFLCYRFNHKHFSSFINLVTDYSSTKQLIKRILKNLFR